jgi:glutamate dehydrogenase
MNTPNPAFRPAGPATLQRPADDDLARLFVAALGESPRPPTPDETAFLGRIVEDYRPEEFAGVPAADLAVALAGFWRFGAGHHDATPNARLIRATGQGGRDLGADLLEIVQPDAPFLVDSVMGEVSDFGVDVRAMFHPMIGQAGARLSMIQVWLAPVVEERRETLVERVLAALADVRAAVGDFAAMKGLLASAIADLLQAAPGDPEALAEDVAFLGWIASERFVFLGARVYDYPRAEDGGYLADEPTFGPEACLGVLRDPDLYVLRRDNEPAVLSANLRWRLEAAPPVVVAKSDLLSRVHRRAYADYVGVRRYGADGGPVGEVRFVGLFTAQAYDQPARDIPLLRRKLASVMTAAGFADGSHNAVRLASILETYPRDELFQVTADELLATALDILHLTDRPKVKLFVRLDPFDRFASILFYAPRDRYDAHLREQVGDILAGAFGGRVWAQSISDTDAPLTRVHYVIGVTPGVHATPDLAALEGDIVRVARTWADELAAAIRAAPGDPAVAPALAAAYGDAFPPGYRDLYDVPAALADIRAIEALGDPGAVSVRAYRTAEDTSRQFRFKLYRRGGAPAALTEVMPILQHLGLGALLEEGFAITPRAQDDAGGRVWIHEFLLEDPRGDELVFEDIRGPFETTFTAVWNGLTESDGFNRLVLDLGISWREAALVRALARYRQQSGLDPSQAVQEAALSAHPGAVRLILDLFATRFDPALELSLEARGLRAGELVAAIEAALRGVESLDEDRVIRRLAALVGALTRTNYYQRDAQGALKPHISFKVASRELADLPAPKPFREIFVAAPHVEGVHLRFGPVARGGLRWSDRRDDFRTEVLGLVKAQQVKNAVIVPVGSKGGFYPKALPRGATPEAIRAEAIGAYKTFLCGLLDITDNIDATGAIVHPADVVVHDGEDPYLVVAADKGTATFSDIANGVAEAYGFWLGDAFASGGSAGYDHKAMAITARGAWESVKRHFRELGKDIQRDPVTVAGVGDMSGDVFGNGMLLSRALKLVAAFDHRHIFLDPTPDPAVAWSERKRIFDLPRSSWDDYDRALISPGGGVFARTLKSIPLGEPIRALLDLKADTLAPGELISAILRARVDLLYLGGIGTYVKGGGEVHLDVGDKANDAVRINGRDLRSKVVGEGANLGLTQAGRIEFAMAGGRINTDAIDNSAGVDTSDHEVNIKILTGMAERAGTLTRENRDTLLASLTDEVAANVLAHNYDQTLALTLLQADAADDLEAQRRFMADLEGRGRLDRGLEGLPDDAALAVRAQAGKGLTRPELAVLLAYGKIDLFDDIIASRAPDDPHFLATLEAYFPKALGRFGAEMKQHRLRREIIATVIDNDMVNLFGPAFPGALRAMSGCDVAALVTAFEAARQVLRFGDAWARVERLDGQAPASGQTALFRELVQVLGALTYGLARRAARSETTIRPLIEAYRPAADTLKTLVPVVLSPFEQKAAVRRAAAWIKAGAPRDVAHSVALMRALTTVPALADLAGAQGWPLPAAAFVYHRVGGVFGFDRLREAAASRPAGDAFERLAIRRLIEDLLTEQSALTGAILAFAGPPPGADSPERAVHHVAAWSSAHPDPVQAARRTLEDIEKAGGAWTFAKLTIANAALRELAAA